MVPRNAVRREGHISAGGVEADTDFLDVDVDDAVHDAVDAAYRSKYGQYSGPVAAITNPPARATTLKLVPHAEPPDRPQE